MIKTEPDHTRSTEESGGTTRDGIRDGIVVSN